MKTILFLTLLATLAFAGCSSEPSNNQNPRRTFNAETGNYEGPTPMTRPNPPTNTR